MSDFIPRGDGDLIVWLTQLKTRLGTYKVQLGLTDPKVAEAVALCDGLIDALKAKAAAKAAYDQAVLDANGTKKANLADLRDRIGRWKTEDGYTDPIGADLGILGSADTVDPDSLQPEFTAVITGGHVQLRFKKFGADGVRFYRRKRGEVGWNFLADDTNSPYDDYGPLAQPGVPEAREYQARALVGGQEVGLPSDIVSVTFGG
jgi:hypothetical protein